MNSIDMRTFCLFSLVLCISIVVNGGGGGQRRERLSCEDGTMSECRCGAIDGPLCREERCPREERIRVCDGAKLVART